MRRLLVLAILAGPIALAAADDPKPTKSATAAAKAGLLDPEVETRALALVRQHLPELAQVLEPLKATNPPEYRKAITELASEARTQADLRAKNPARADLALDFWKARSRVELIAAQLASSPSPERESQLRTAIEARVDVEIRRQQFEADQAEANVKRLRENLARAEANRDQARERLERSEQNRANRVENRYRALLPKPKPVPPTATKPKIKPAAGVAPMPMPVTSAHVVPMPAPQLANDAVPLPDPLVEGQTR